jgi:hypothetical protein
MLRSVSTRLTGLTILVLGIWGGIIPFVGPYFHFTLGPDSAWTWTSGRLYLDVLPAIVAVIGGLLLLGAGPWPSGRVGALLALVAGIWFAIGPDVSHVWYAGGQEGVGHGSTSLLVLERLSFHGALGAIMAALAGYALPGVFGPRPARAAAVAGGATTAGAAAPAAGRRAPVTGAPVGAAAAPADGEGEPVPAEGETATQTIRPVRRDRAGV